MTCAPVSGALYDAYGIKAPYAFGLALVAVDLAMRLSVVEHSTALRHGHAARWAAIAEDPKATADDQPRLPFRARFSAFRSGRLQILYATRFVKDFTAQAIYFSSVTIVANARFGYNASAAGRLLIAALAPSFVTGPLGGWLGDRWGNRRIALIGLAICVVATGLLAIESSVAVFAVVLAIQCAPRLASGLTLAAGALALFSSPTNAELAHVADALGFDQGLVFSGDIIFGSVGGLVGPVISGQLLGRRGAVVGWRILSIVVAAMWTTVLALWLVSMRPMPARAECEEKIDVAPKGVQ